jgi:glutamate-1-semialdehyde 2,1-aminomutase
MKFDASLALQKRVHDVIPGGSHTYAKGDDQFPELMPAYIVRGKGCHVWDADGNEFIEYGMGARAVTLGHGHPSVVEAAYKQMQLGTNFIRPATIELEVAEQLLSLIKGADMCKFAKNGSDANDGALKLARAYTGRDLVAICGDQPFFSVSDWFIGTTPMNAGIPEATRKMTLKFRYNDLASLEQLFTDNPGQIAAVILEAEKEKEPLNNFLHEVQRVCKQHGAVFILDEMITGFRWHLNGAQAMHDIVPDLSCFGKALGNGFAVSAVVGKREIMELGGLYHDKDRVFLGSTTHGAESHALAAAREVMNVYSREPVIQTMWERGERLGKAFNKAAADCGLQDHIVGFGRPCCMVYGTKDQNKQPSQGFRTLFIQEAMKRGVLATSLIISYAHTEQDIDRSVEAFHGAMQVYRKALDEGLEKYLVGRPVKPVWRTRNN